MVNKHGELYFSPRKGHNTRRVFFEASFYLFLFVATIFFWGGGGGTNTIFWQGLK